MIRVPRVPKPRRYDREVKQPGDAWLRANKRAKRPKDLWSPFLPYLADGFSNLCGYAAMLDPTGGTVDHYLSFRSRPDLTYDWTNYRFASQFLNASKKTADDEVLDPHLVGDGWFEILLPSLQLCATDKVPARYRAKADLTLQRLKLRDGEKVIRWRRQFYELYQRGRIDLEGLRELAPLIAAAVERQAAASKPRKKVR